MIINLAAATATAIEPSRPTPTNAPGVIAQGWTPTANTRGTLDIIWSCAATILLCNWAAVCINVPKPSWKKRRVVLQKFLAILCGCIGPELVFEISLCQWRSARRSVREFKDSKYEGWTKRHAFLADMGGFRLAPEDYHQNFPVTARQLHWLVVRGYVDYKEACLPPEDIDDKNKSDALVRSLTLFQVFWFMFSTFWRLGQHLGTSTLEILTLTWVFPSLVTIYLWWEKPNDVKTPKDLVPNQSLARILSEVGRDLDTPIRQTPMEFVPQDFFQHQVYWYYGVHCLRRIRLGPLSIPFAKANDIPWQKVPDDHCPAPCDDSWFGAILFVGQGCCMIAHAIAWNFYFPTYVERLLWHISTIAVFVTWLGVWFFDKMVWKLLPTYKELFPGVHRKIQTTFYKERCKPEDESVYMTYFLIPWRWGVDYLQERSPEFAPEDDVPLKAVIPVACCCFFYLWGRLYIVAESFVGLRSLPQSTFTTISGPNWLPHI